MGCTRFQNECHIVYMSFCADHLDFVAIYLFPLQRIHAASSYFHVGDKNTVVALNRDGRNG